ncbi:hypothetical protein [Desulfonatronovibrio magnus]|uniref:hypothetical protein n=1 Tax=Desulfonatronovibrio magnus TaxID=698827 RepID=UPI0005EBC7E7|nr:hypothetical protein [Desulfonatronovibrio magnus]
MLGFAFISTFTTDNDVVGPEVEDEDFQTTENDDTIIGLVETTATNSTLNRNDIIDGGDGTDTLKVEMKGNFLGFNEDKGLTSVEIVELTNVSGFNRTFNAVDIEGVETYKIGAASSNFTLNNLAEIPVIELTQAKGTFNAKFAEDVLDGDDDNLSLKLNGVGSEDNNVTIDVDPDGTEELEVVSVEAIADTDSYVNLSQTAVETIVVTGSGNLAVAAVDSGLENFNATAAKGNIEADLSGAELKEVGTGTGDDKITLDDMAFNAEISSAGGDNELVLDVSGTNLDGGQKAAISGFQTLTLATGTGTGDAVNFLSEGFEDIETINLKGQVDDTINLLDSQLQGLTLNHDRNLAATGTNATGAFSADVSGAVEINLSNSKATTTGTYEFETDYTFDSAESLTFNTAKNMTFAGEVSAAEANNLMVVATGKLGDAEFSADKASSIDIHAKDTVANGFTVNAEAAAEFIFVADKKINGAEFNSEGAGNFNINLKEAQEAGTVELNFSEMQSGTITTGGTADAQFDVVAPELEQLILNNSKGDLTVGQNVATDLTGLTTLNITNSGGEVKIGNTDLTALAEVTVTGNGDKVDFSDRVIKADQASFNAADFTGEVTGVVFDSKEAVTYVASSTGANSLTIDGTAADGEAIKLDIKGNQLENLITVKLTGTEDINAHADSVINGGGTKQQGYGAKLVVEMGANAKTIDFTDATVSFLDEIQFAAGVSTGANLKLDAAALHNNEVDVHFVTAGSKLSVDLTETTSTIDFSKMKGTGSETAVTKGVFEIKIDGGETFKLNSTLAGSAAASNGLYEKIIFDGTGLADADKFTITGFNTTDDVISFDKGNFEKPGKTEGVFIASGAASNADFATGARSNAVIFIVAGTGVADGNNASDIADYLSDAVVVSGMQNLFALTDGTDTYLWFFDGKSGENNDATVDADELTLVGVLNGVSDIAAAQFELT